MDRQPQFSMTPEIDQLSQTPREFCFIPADPTAPTTLTRKQVAHYNEQGYVKGLTIFSPEEMLDLRAYFDQLLADVLAAGGDSYSISTAHLKHGRVYDLLGHPRIVAYVQDLLGEHVIGWGSHFFCKMPHDGKQVDWHQDATYWPFSHTRTVTVWLAIDDADRENACMQFLAGSHHQGVLPFRESSNQSNVLNQAIDVGDRYGDPIDVELPAGQISLHNDLLVHGSQANDSDRRRCGLTLRYCAAEVRAGLDWNQKGIVVAGADPSGHWANPPRPASD
ncbi:phytanoyl-CoA dioxygenase family protein [Lignipirellula cremea]|uniref:Phytanoyl-CoA dioxygenase (PhyH) n=1 Tax=Lignipirellula cremea TaxID=2528010 RepID=A0A518DLY1_9BACT|nr:phytanoyl-CoA dioxygenase family protein [Lignipirellula cremea]QDU92835.1 Phytanoyl-CoA dioxygenase (PhyH) [Lignipirellula cremea]